MADSGAAQNKLGELFVDIGVGGLGKTLKALNSVSASFLLTKNAAQQAIKPIIDLSKKGGAFITSLDKFSAISGLSVQNLQKLKQWAEVNNVEWNDFGNQILNVQKSLREIQMGQGAANSFARLGIDTSDLDANNPLEALDKIKDRTQHLDPVMQRIALSWLGLSDSMIYTFLQAQQPLNSLNTGLDESLILTEKEAETLRKVQTGWNRLGVTWEAATNKLIANLPIIQRGLNYMERTITRIFSYIEDHSEVLETLFKPFVWLAKKLGDYTDWADKQGAEIADYNAFVLGPSSFPGLTPGKKNDLIDKARTAYIRHEGEKQAKKTYEPYNIQQAQIANMLNPLPYTNGISPNNILNNNQKQISFTVNQDINGVNAYEIAAEGVSKFQQAYNMAIIQNQGPL